MIGGDKTNKQIQTATAPSRFKTAVKHSLIYAAILCLTTIFIITISILSDINQNAVVHAVVYAEVADGGGNSSSTAGRSPDAIQTRVNQFYAYTKLQACHDSIANAREYDVTPDQMVNAAIVAPTMIYYYRGFTKKGGEGELCSTTAIDSIASELGMDIDFLEILRKRAGRNTERCPDETQTDKTCWNYLSTMDVADEITKLLEQASSYSSSSMEAADWFIVYDKAFDICTGVSGFSKYTATTNATGDIPENSTGDDEVWRFKGSTMENLNDDGEYDIVTVYAPVDVKEYRWGVSGSKVAHSVWYGTAPARDNVSGGVEKNCDEIAESVRQYFPEYIATINRYMTATGETVSADDATTSTTADDEEDPCQAGFLGFGWIFCPGANLIDSFLNGFLNWIDSQLNWTMLAENNTVIRERWQKFLNIANIAFAIAFLVMIYSMATSTGLSNYDIKKMLPRLIVVAIAVNLSFYICAAIVDIFNIIGNGIFGIINPDGDTWSVSVGADGFVGFGTTIVAIIGVVFIFGISAIVALAIIFICLCVREIALIALVVISPIAFVCYLLPNTQKWFQRWADYFIRLLAIYPMFMAVWGAAKWVASLKGSTQPSKDAMPGFVVSLTCMIAPAIAIIPLFKMSGGIMGMVASRAAGSKLATKGHATQSYMRGKGVKVAKNNVATRKAAGFVGERAGDLAEKFGDDSYIGSRFKHLAGAATAHSNGRASNLEYAHAFDAQLDNQASLIASNMDYETRKSIATGNHGDKQVDWRVLKAAIEQSGDLDSVEIDQLIVNAENTAQTLDKNNQHAAAQELRDTVYSQNKDNSAYMGDKEFLVQMRNGAIGSNVQQEYDASVIRNASDISKSTLSKTSADSQSYMYDKLKSAQEAGANIDNAVNNLRSAAEQINDDSKTLNNMSASARSALTGINDLKTGAEAIAAEALNLDRTAADLNSTNQTIRQ